MSLRERMKASDVLRNTEFLLPRKSVPFSKAFSEISDISVEVEEKGRRRRTFGMNENAKYVYDMKNPPGEYINCSNSLCYN